MRILFVMDKHVDRGSIQAVSAYVRAGAVAGHEVALYGRPDEGFPSIPFSTEAETFDRVVYIVESSLKWMTGLRMPRLLAAVPRARRAIVDADGMYNPLVAVDGYDRNHPSNEVRSTWVAHYHEVADRILQPTSSPLEPGVRSALFYGYDQAAEISSEKSPQKQHDLIHVGHNWWRWREISRKLLPALETVRGRLDGVCFMGSWWDAPPAGAVELGLEAAFGVDPERFRRLRIRVEPPVPYTQVVRAMSTARLNVMTQRPLFRHLGLLTSKYFEVFCADTIPLVMLEPHEAEAIYGPAGRELALDEGVAGKLVDALERPARYRELVHAVREHLRRHHSYEARIRNLVAALKDASSGTSA
jgi:hypothetical protein